MKSFGFLRCVQRADMSSRRSDVPTDVHAGASPRDGRGGLTSVRRPPSHERLRSAVKVQAPLQGDEAKATLTLIGQLVSWVAGCLLLVPLWAGLNFAFGTALDGPIGAVVMETPCQRLAGTSQPLRRYTLGGGKARISSAVCHFDSGPIRVADRPTDGLGFSGRELAYLVIGFAGYASCFAGALVLAVGLVRAGRRLLGARSG
jgi:hypothetical protein